jgi:hypothetical protein
MLKIIKQLKAYWRLNLACLTKEWRYINDK